VEESKTRMDQVRFENCRSDRYGYRPAIQSAKFPRMAGNKALCILQGPCNDTARTWAFHQSVSLRSIFFQTRRKNFAEQNGL